MIEKMNWTFSSSNSEYDKKFEKLLSEYQYKINEIIDYLNNKVSEPSAQLEDDIHALNAEKAEPPIDCTCEFGHTKDEWDKQYCARCGGQLPNHPKHINNYGKEKAERCPDQLQLAYDGLRIRYDNLSADYKQLKDMHNLGKPSVSRNELCGVCGGKLVEIRGRHPNDPRRNTCPTCSQEKLEQIHEISDKDYGKSYCSK